MGSVLSMVVPIYNVAPYLHDCLVSIVHQTHRDLEVVMVDDGSTDDSARIAAGFATADSRFRLVSQANQGLGAARNAGVRHSSGDYLMFVDSDDLLPSYAAELLVSTVELTGSDFAAGNAYRLNSKGVRPSALHTQPFARTDLRTHVSRRPDLLSDRTAWNKVFRRQFWDAHELRFPEGVLYEDTPVIVPAHVLARSVDIVELPVYYWREREGGDRSITQRRTELKGFVDRIAGVDWVSQFLADNKQQKVKRSYDASALRGDLMIFMRVLPETDEEFQQAFLDRCNDFLDRVADGVLDTLHTNLRLQWHLVRQRMLPELLTVILALRETGSAPVVRRGLKRYHDLPFLDDGRPELPRELYRAGTPQPRTAVHRVELAGGRLHVRGHAFIQGSRASVPLDAARMLWLTTDGGRRTRPVLGRPRRCPDATLESNLPGCSYDWSGFAGSINLAALRGRDGQWHEGDWTVNVGVVGRGLASRGPLKPGVDSRLLKLTPSYVDDETRIKPVIVSGVLVLRVEKIIARATGFRITDDASTGDASVGDAGHAGTGDGEPGPAAAAADPGAAADPDTDVAGGPVGRAGAGGVLEIEGELRGVGRPGLPAGAAPATAAIQLSRAPGVIWRTYPALIRDDGRFVARIPLADLPGEQPPPVIGEVGDRWLVELVIDGEPAPARVADTGAGAVPPRSGSDGPDLDRAVRRSAAGPAGSARRIAVDRPLPGSRHLMGRRELRLQATLDGYLELALLPAGPVVTGAAWLPDDALELRGDLPAETELSYTDLELVLRVWGRREQRIFPAEVHGTGWRAVINPLAVPSYAGPIELRAGNWDLLYRHAASPGRAQPQPGSGGGEYAPSSSEGMVDDLPFAPAALDQLPVRGTAAHRQLVLRRARAERAALKVGADLDLDEQGMYGQSRLRTRVYPAALRQPLRDAVLFNSFTGRQFSDSPRAIHSELVARDLPLEHLWTVLDGQVALPDTARAVRFLGREWYEAYATSRYIVTNQHLPEWFRRREGQVVVQTWHGTPLKRIAHDIADVRFADPTYLEKLAVETPNWSLLLSPNRFSTPILRRAFRYEGEILESGYPRNDILCRDAAWTPRPGTAAATGREEMAAQVRAGLGLPAGKKVVLYAPTWRDDEYYGPGRYRLSLQLNLDRAAEALGEDHVLLIRSHPNVADEIPQAGGGFVWDVSTYPDIADLLAATDVLVTDYSSVMFDFANTGRPMLFFTYDLRHYRDRLRGFYFDFEAEAPGPLLSTSDEVIEAIREIDAVAARYSAAYRAFAERACDLDDGYATARVVDRLLALAQSG